MKAYDTIIVGTGHGAAQAAIALRQHGFVGSIAMIGRDSVPPYERPPLSKDYLAREKNFERIMIRPPAFWDDKQIELCLNAEVTFVDPAARTVSLHDGRSFSYENLIWAAGGDPRKLVCAGADLIGVHAVRDKADVDAIMHALDQGARRAVIIGGGYIGLEAAAVLSKLGCEVVLLEVLPRVLARVAGEGLSRFFEAEHRTHGVDVRLDARVNRLVGSDGKVHAVELEGGEALACDLVIVGIGILPSVAPLAAAGAQCSNGVEVDAFCRTSLPHVYAIGDCAAYSNQFAQGVTVRLESVQNANDMATSAAKAICGRPEAFLATPWFWSNQYDLKLQTVGLSMGYDQSVIRGDPLMRCFSVIYLRSGKVIALDCVNATKDFVQGRKLVEASASVDIAALENPDISLKDLVPG